MPDKPVVVLRKDVRRLSAWTSLVSRTIKFPGAAEPQEYHSLAQADYVTILAVTADGHIPLVRQYRPALERETLELPGGILDGVEDPGVAAARELAEETGFEVCGTPVLLGHLCPDSGRLDNHLWAFFAEAQPRAGHEAEPGVKSLVMTRAELRAAILDGSFDHALHLALITLAELRGLFRL